MAGKNTAAFGIYRNESSLRNGVEALEREGFRTEDISVPVSIWVGPRQDLDLTS
jgi:hypothetical protein